MTPERIAELRALAEAATPGPWTFRTPKNALEPGYESVIDCGPNTTLLDAMDSGDGPYGIVLPDDAAFIAAARTALPEALDAIERVRALQVQWADWDDPTLASELLAALEGKSDG